MGTRATCIADGLHEHRSGLHSHVPEYGLAKPCQLIGDEEHPEQDGAADDDLAKRRHRGYVAEADCCQRHECEVEGVEKVVYVRVDLRLRFRSVPNQSLQSLDSWGVQCPLNKRHGRGLGKPGPQLTHLCLVKEPARHVEHREHCDGDFKDPDPGPGDLSKVVGARISVS